MKSKIFNIFKLTIKDWKQRKWKSHNGLKNRKPNSYLNSTPIAIKGNAGQNRWHNQFNNTLLCWVITIIYRKYNDLVSSKILERERVIPVPVLIEIWNNKEWSLELCCVTYGIWYLIHIHVFVIHVLYSDISDLIEGINFHGSCKIQSFEDMLIVNIFSLNKTSIFIIQ